MTPERWQRIEDVFAQAQEAPEAERATRVHALAGDDRALADEVLSLLAAAADAPGYLDGLASRLALAEPSPPDCSGRTIGPYRLIRLLGHGGMGSVYLARRADGVFDQTVALKLLPPGATQPALERRFRAERQILAGLQHPNIARMLDGGLAADGTPWFAMEYVDGMPLDDYCRRHRPATERKLALFLAVCGAVEAAHRNLVIHRDLKPANVLVAKDGSVKLLDFGIATLLDSDAAGAGEKQPLSPAYASPEQWRGGPLTTAVDVWGLGVVLYELLAERRPFDGRGHAADAPPLPPGRVREGLPPDLDAIVATALQPLPERRYASVALLADDVRRHLERRPLRARGHGWRYRLGCFARRHRLGVAGAAAIALLLAALSAVSMHAALQSRAQAARIAAERDASRQVARFLTDVFAAADPATQQGNLLTARELLDRGAVRARTELAARPDLQAAMLATIGRVYRQIGLPDRALPLLEQSLAQRRRQHAAPHPEIAESLHELGLAQWRAGRPQAAQATLRRALDMRHALQRGSDDAVSSRIALGELLLDTGKPADAERELRAAVQDAHTLGDAGAPRQARALYLLATALHHGGRLPEAADSARRAAALYRRLPTAPTPEAAESLLLLAGMERVARRPDAQVRALYAEALALHRRLYGAGHPRVAAVLNEAALAVEQAGDVATAQAQLEQAIAIYRHAQPPDPDGLAAALANFGDLRRRRGDPDGAERALDEALRLSDAKPDAAAGALYLRAQVHQVRGDLAKAARDLDQSAALYTRAFGPHNPMLLRLALARGELAHARGDHARAQALLRRALDGYQAMFGPGHARVAEARRALAACLREDGG